MRVLLVEDSGANRLVAEHQLQQLGCACTAVDNGRAAIEVAREASFDLILMDCHMPEVDGYAATAGIRCLEAETGRRARIVALTALVSEGERGRCLAAGMDEYLAKPFQAPQLAAIVRAALTDEALATGLKGRVAEMRQRGPSLVIFDLNNPRTDPMGTLAAMKRDEALASIPTVGYVSHVDADVVNAARTVGVDDVVARSTFSQRLREILSAYR